MPLKERERGRFYLHHQFIGKKKKNGSHDPGKIGRSQETLIGYNIQKPHRKRPTACSLFVKNLQLSSIYPHINENSASIQI